MPRIVTSTITGSPKPRLRATVPRRAQVDPAALSDRAAPSGRDPHAGISGRLLDDFIFLGKGDVMLAASNVDSQLP